MLGRIEDLMDILSKETRVMSIIKNELRAIQEKHANPRLTDLVPDEGEIAIEDLIANEGVIITITHNAPDQTDQRQFLSRPTARRQRASLA